MAQTKEFFLSVTQRLFSNWTALKLAVEHGMGPRERAIEFCPHITEIIYTHDKIDSNDLAAELEDYMDEYFSTELGDDSAIQVARELLRFHRYCMEGNEVLAKEELAKVPVLQTWIVTPDSVKPRNSRQLPTDDKCSSDSDEEDDKQMDTVDDEWVEVKTRRKK